MGVNLHYRKRRPRLGRPVAITRTHFAPKTSSRLPPWASAGPGAVWEGGFQSPFAPPAGPGATSNPSRRLALRKVRQGQLRPAYRYRFSGLLRKRCSSLQSGPNGRGSFGTGLIQAARASFISPYKSHILIPRGDRRSHRPPVSH